MRIRPYFFVTAFLILTNIIYLFSCKTSSELTSDIEILESEIVYKDSVRYYDSVVVVPIERYIDIVRSYDTLFLETSQAEATCWVDSIWLKGEIKNKDVVKYVYKDRWRTRDSLVYVDKFVDREVEKIVEKKNPVNFWLVGIVGFLILSGLLFSLRHFLR